MQQYLDRYDAGKVLAEALKNYAKDQDAIVLALPRGGVPVAYQIARSLSLPLDVFIVRKLGMPGHEELAMGAIAMGGTIVFNDDVLREMSVPKSAVNSVIQAETEELKRREIKYRGNRPFPKLTNKTIIIVDDGIATGATMRAAIQALRKHNPLKIVMAVPVAAISTYHEMQQLVEEVVCPLTPDGFYAVGQWYQDFSQTSDEEVYELLHQ